MEHAVEKTKQPDAKAGLSRGREPSAGPAPLHPMLQLQQQAGNQAVQELLRAGVIRAKLSISQPGDPEEEEADAVADRIMRSPAGHAATSCSCTGEDEMCDECRQKRSATIARKSSGAGNPAVSHKAIGGVLRTPGHPLDSATRAFFEPRFGSDFSNVRVHADASAAASARSINALAYTAGEHLVFGKGQYSPQTVAGQQLLAHELAHVVQQGPHAGRFPALVQRKYDDPYTYDPENERAWSYLESRDLRSPYWQKPFQATLAAAPQAALDKEKELKDAPAPASDEDRERNVQQIRTLIRLNALGLMASNRAAVARKKEELLTSQQQPGSSAGAQSGGETAAVNARAIRAAASQAVLLNQKKDELEGYERNLQLLAGSQSRVGGESFLEALQKIVDNTEKYRSDRIRSYFRNLSKSLEERRSLDRGLATALIFNMGRFMADWRHEQVQGVKIALEQIYEAFPFLTQLAPEDVPSASAATDQQLMERVRTAFDDLLAKIDYATAKIGGDVDPFDLPQAVNNTRDSLNQPMRDVLKQAIQDHQVKQFWENMALTFAQVLLVFVPVVGPALAAALGVAQVVSSVQEALTRYQISEASTSPEGGVLGVHGPSMFEWAMLGVQVALTAADLGSLWKELNAGRMKFPEAEPQVAPEAGAGRGVSDLPSGDPAVVRDVAPEGVSAIDRAGLEASRETPGKLLSGSSLQREFDAVADSPRRPSSVSGYLEEVELPNGHTWRRTREGRWCRFSNGPTCFTADLSTSSVARPRNVGRPEFTPAQQFRHDRVADYLQEHGLDWGDLFKSRDEVESFFAGYSSTDEALTALEARARRAVDARSDIAGSRLQGGGESAGSGLDPFAAPPTGAEIRQSQPGTATGGGNLQPVSGRIFDPTRGRVAAIPGQIAARLRNVQFRSWREFRETLWQLVAADPALSAGFTPRNRARMASGLAPYVEGGQQVGGGANAVLQLNHIRPLEQGGGLYDLGNIEIVSPLAHQTLGKYE